VINKATTTSKPVADYVQNYAHMVLEMGLVYKELLDVCKTPDRSRIVRLMKQCMVLFKAKSNNSKYAVEVHRFLVQQLCLLSELEAHEVVYSMFVNTKGHAHSHIPADLQMEYLVKLIKNTSSTCTVTRQSRTLQRKHVLCPVCKP
jgi:hypothetical protein